MPWSFQIARVFDIPIRLHLTFLLLLGWLAFLARGNTSLPLVAVGLFACVVAHELGHSLVARRFGVQVLDITLLPIGGVARMASIPREPRQELWIAVAGPAVNFVLGPLFLALHVALGGGWEMAALNAAPLAQLGALNLGLGLFNLLPAFPMDGGRILRAVLAMRMPYAGATRIATSLGQALAFGLGFFGLLGNPLMIFVALFVFIGAAEEGNRVQTQSFTEGVPVRDAMLTRFFTLTRADPLGRAADLLLAGTQHDFPVLDGSEMVGVLTRMRLIQALETSGRDVYVSEVMEPSPTPVAPDTSLMDVLERMAAEGLTLLPVQDAQGLVGLVTTDNTAEYVLVKSALLRNSERQTRPA
jgi:Zn-dependent protease/CBS domain-containing protein